MSRYIIDISSIFRVPGLPDMISENDSRSKEKLENVDQYRQYIGYDPTYRSQN